jgi:hypothetical protein
MLPLSLILLLAGCAQIVRAVTFDAGTEFRGEAGQGPVTFTQQIIASDMDSDGVKVMFTDFAMGGEAYGTIGFATAVGSSMTVSKASSAEIKYTAIVTAALATTTVYTPGQGSPTGVTGAQSWSKTGDAVTVILPSGTHQVTLSYVEESTVPGENSNPIEDLLPQAMNFVEDNTVIISVAVLGWYFLMIPKSIRRKWTKKARRTLS